MAYIRNLIIDGHGRELVGETFDFKRTKNNECDLYCYVRQGISIGYTQSNTIIANAVEGNISQEIAKSNSSRIGGVLVTDKLLGAIQLDKDKTPQWNNDGLFTTGPTRITIGGIAVDEFQKNHSTYIRLPIGAKDTLKLSQIINYYNAGQYNILWCVCRAD